MIDDDLNGDGDDRFDVDGDFDGDDGGDVSVYSLIRL